MSNAWETAVEDVENVIHSRFGIDTDVVRVSYIHDRLDYDMIERAALYGDDMEDQYELATNEIERQIIDNHWFPKPIKT